MKQIYIMISRTHTGFAHAIQKIGKVQYNHASIALDENLDQLFSFARPKHHAVLLARLVQESICRYTLKKHPFVDVVIFRIAVSENQFEQIKSAIYQIYNDEEYIYNLFSVLSYPMIGGFSTYKAYSCIEFVMYLLRLAGVKEEYSLCCYRPDDLLEVLEDSIVYKGNLLEYKQEECDDSEYFSRLSVSEIKKSIVTPNILIYRILFMRKGE